MEELEKARRADGASYFMTTTLQLPTTSSAISMHYSAETRFLFVSMESELFRWRNPLRLYTNLLKLTYIVNR